MIAAWLQTHNQAVDPNLVRLAEAFEVAATEMQKAAEVPRQTHAEIDHTESP